jgi:hypothetical protein
MRNLVNHLVLLGAAVCTMSACGDSNPLPGITPSVSISSPANNSTVNLPVDKQVSLNFSTNYTLKSPGTCQGAANCGSIYLLVDSTNCNLPTLAYNSLVVASPANADMSKCAMPTGMHTITLELHHDDGTVVLDLINNPVTAQVVITAQ